MLTLEEATEKAQRRVQELAEALGEELHMERSERFDSERCWGFGFNTVAWWKTRHPRDGLVGNGPIIVDKDTGAVYNVPSGGLLLWFDEYKRTGLPPEWPPKHKAPSGPS